jgi:hypothetical protein
MRTPFRWTLPGQLPLQVLCACCALWAVPAVTVGAPEQITPSAEVSTRGPAATEPTSAPKPTTSNNTARIGGVSVDRRALTLVAMACLIGMIAGWSSGGPREPRVRLLTKPQKANLSVLVPPGPTPRLIPSDAPNAKRARPSRAQVPRQTPPGTTRSGIVDYIAPFVDAGKPSEDARVDYLLESDDSVEESLDPHGSS